MSPLLVLRSALSSLGSNKLRSSLTLLGIVIGVAAVISLMAIGRGVQQSITQRIQALGTNLLFVRPGATSQGGVSSGSGGGRGGGRRRWSRGERGLLLVWRDGGPHEAAGRPAEALRGTRLDRWPAADPGADDREYPKGG